MKCDARLALLPPKERGATKYSQLGTKSYLFAACQLLAMMSSKTVAFQDNYL